MQKIIPSRRDMMYQERFRGRFARGMKAAEALCSGCGAHYQSGRWSWTPASPAARTTHCPACQREAANMAAGTLEIPGDFFSAHRDELTRLVENTARLERQDHPLERLMPIEEQAETASIRTTGMHLITRIAHALSRQFGGRLIAHADDRQAVRHLEWHP